MNTFKLIIGIFVVAFVLAHAATPGPSTEFDVYVDYHEDSILKRPIGAKLVIPKLAENPEGEYTISLSNGMTVKVIVPYLPPGRPKIEVHVTVTPIP